MFEVIMFGGGENGNITHTEKIERVIKLSDPRFQHHPIVNGVATAPEIEYRVVEFQLDGSIYLVGYHGNKPSDAVISSNIRHSDPKLKPYKTL
ncbi:hypothetical protein NB069_10475 [Leclercia adecarboxylata]|uniref:hypothetical protein n=1 Tax=Leclercia adecarboxylata TaxID=83655 RepID=UPI00202ABA4E|nr:hypothetical protein [Leclercia adecarboxylata]URO01264.1 hypothetical protein NB069_10475 [Leclercia adecarboxylata]